MSARDPEWLQRGLDAMRETFDVDGTTKQAMIYFLLDEGFWDSRRLTDAAARTRFNACMNPMKTEFFKLSELWALMKHFRRYQLLIALCDDIGFARPEKIPTRQRLAELKQEQAAITEVHARQMADITAQIDALAGAEDAIAPSSNVRVHPAHREIGGRFALDDADDDGTMPGGF